MKKLLIIVGIISISISASFSQCTGLTTYDLTVSTSAVYHPTTTGFMSAYICAGGILIDSANCCTRFVHISPGGTYEAGGMAYGIVYIQSGGTFNANNGTGFFNVTYEAGATILNFTGPSTLCNAITFSPALCTINVGITESNQNSDIKVYPNPCNEILHLKNLSENSLVIIYDVTGKKVMETILKNNELNVSSILPGMYSYSVKGNDNNISKGKFAIVR